MHDKSLWQHDPAIFLEFEFPFSYFNYNVTCENPDDYIFTGNSGKPRKFHENNVNDFTYHRAFLVMILESFWVTIIIMPHLLYSFAFYVSDAIFYIPSHDSRLKGRRVDRSGGFATKSVFHEASRVSLMVMLMEIWHQWRTVEISHNRHNMTFCHEMLFATAPSRWKVSDIAISRSVSIS